MYFIRRRAPGIDVQFQSSNLPAKSLFKVQAMLIACVVFMKIATFIFISWNQHRVWFCSVNFLCLFDIKVYNARIKSTTLQYGENLAMLLHSINIDISCLVKLNL